MPLKFFARMSIPSATCDAENCVVAPNWRAVAEIFVIAASISARNRSRRVVLPLALQAVDANVICFILLSPLIALMYIVH